ncbi:hypothetical protein PYCC9005_004057 [Savitreella phatthalungensis]
MARKRDASISPPRLPSPPRRPTSRSRDSSPDSQASDAPKNKRLKTDLDEWPAARSQIESAREFVRRVAASTGTVIIAPDKDADGLSAGAIMYRTLVKLGKSPDTIAVHLLEKGTTIHDDYERDQMLQHQPADLIVLDHGSRGGPPILPGIPTLILDHHYSFEFPEGAVICTAAHSPPIATSALLTYEVCDPLHPELRPEIDYLGALGTMGDLGATVKWDSPFPSHLGSVVKAKGKKNFSDAVGLVNAPRRSSAYNVIEAWNSILCSTEPSDILHHSRNPHLKQLIVARDQVFDETERNTHTAPLFTRDKRTACLVISSPCQVHPVIATRWAGFLKSKDLCVVMVANKGYMPGKVHFSCRIPKFRRHLDGTPDAVDLQQVLKEYAARDPDLATTLQQMGSFAKGHREASGGVLPNDLWDKLYDTMEIGPSIREKKPPKETDQKQRNKLTNYFTSPSKSK